MWAVFLIFIAEKNLNVKFNKTVVSLKPTTGFRPVNSEWLHSEVPCDALQEHERSQQPSFYHKRCFTFTKSLVYKQRKVFAYLLHQLPLKKSKRTREPLWVLEMLKASGSEVWACSTSQSPLPSPPCSHQLTDNIPEPIPSMYTRQAAWTKDVTVEMVSGLFKAASSPIVFMKLTQDRISLILTTHLRPNSWWVSQSVKSSITSAMSAPKTQESKGICCLGRRRTGIYNLGPTDGLKGIYVSWDYMQIFVNVH